MTESKQNKNINIDSTLVTVYILNHNYEHFLERTIQSVLKQTMRDFELIIIDDGSTDNSREIIERYSSHEKVITIFQHNKGLNVSNNIALRAARGHYIMRVDSDDYLDENALMVLSGILDRNPDVGLVFPDYFLVDEEGTVLELVRRHNFDEVTLLDQPAHGACTLIRRQCLIELNGYDESFQCQDGYDLWIRFIEHHQIKNVNLPLFYYRQHSKNLTRNEEHVLETRSKIIEKHARLKGHHYRSIAIIPVRGKKTDPGSLVLRRLGGKTLLDWTLNAAIKAKHISGVVLTTPDEDLLDYVSVNYGKRVFAVKRDSNLARPNTYIEDTIFHALGKYTLNNPKPDIIVTLYIESPFRSYRYIDSAIDVMELFGTDTVIAVRSDVGDFYRHNGSGLEPLLNTGTLRLERDELYREVGQMRVVKRDFLEEHRCISGGKVGHVVLDQSAALRLHSEVDWEVAEFLVGRYRIRPGM